MTNMVCASGLDLLMDYLEGALADDVRGAIEAHVAACPRCVAFIESYQATPKLLRELTAIDMPADLEASLREHLRRARRGD